MREQRAPDKLQRNILAQGVGVRIFCEPASFSMTDHDRPVCTPLYHAEIQQCQVRRCTARASHFVVWPTKTGASGSYRCPAHARAFAAKHAIPFEEKT
jgi:hypothetical protein